MPLRQDKETHKIWCDSISPSKVVNEIFPFDKTAIPEKYLQMGVDKGICVHHQMEVYTPKNEIIGCPHGIKTHTTNFEWGKKWWDKFKKKYTLSNIRTEHIMYSPKLDMVGIADLIVEDSLLGTIIVDYKTTKEIHKEKEAIQLYLYGCLLANKWTSYKEFTYIVVNTNVHKAYELTHKEMEQGKINALKGYKSIKERKKIEEIWD